MGSHVAGVLRAVGVFQTDAFLSSLPMTTRVPLGLKSMQRI